MEKGTNIDNIAQLMNTSARMITGVYLGHTNQALINLIKRVPTKLKIINWLLYPLNCFGVALLKWWGFILNDKYLLTYLIIKYM